LVAVWQWFNDQEELITNEHLRFVLALDGKKSLDELDTRMRDRLRYADRAEVDQSFEAQRNQLELLTMLGLLTTTEAVLRVDYKSRGEKRLRDPLSKEYRRLQQNRGENVRLDEDLLTALKDEVKPPSAVGDFRGALKLRHWLAHGRWWTPKLGRDYSPDNVFEIATALTAALSSLT
jgi:hypothetical protein